MPLLRGDNSVPAQAKKDLQMKIESPDFTAIVTQECDGYKDGEVVQTHFKPGDEVHGALAMNFVSFGWAKKKVVKKRGRPPKNA